jgi:hypothetical protein
VDGQLASSQKLRWDQDVVPIEGKKTRWCVGLSNIDKPRYKSFTGSLDEVCHYDRELSADEVEMLYEAGGQK